MAGTAQDAYRQMLREHVAPALRALGFKRGPSLGAFRYETATHAAEVRFRKSRSSTRQEVDFWVDLHASWIKTEWVYWEWTLEALAPEPLGSHGHRPGRAGRQRGAGRVPQLWVARHPGCAGQPRLPTRPRGPLAPDIPQTPRGRFPGEAEADRQAQEELEQIMARAGTDSRAFQALLAQLETDPDPAIRQGVAWYLLGRAHEERSSQALRAAATEDEDVEVRWIARYALRVAHNETSANTAGPASSP
jgi:HEAT repeats